MLEISLIIRPAVQNVLNELRRIYPKSPSRR